MSSTAGHGAKVSICDVKGCECEAERSLNLKQLQKCSLVFKGEISHNAHLCKEHYKHIEPPSLPAMIGAAVAVGMIKHSIRPCESTGFPVKKMRV